MAQNEANIQVINEAVEQSQVLNAAEQAAQELAKLQEELKAAKAKLAEAKAAAKKANGRPIRRCNWHVYSMVEAEGEPIFKSDVHYCAEKFAIDAIKAGELTEAFTFYATKNSDLTTTFKLVQHLYLDANGNLVID